MKYDSDGPFNDPIVRCCDCQRLILRQILGQQGCCPDCGSRRVRNVLTLNEKEMEVLKDLKIDPEFLGLFEGVSSEGVIHAKS